jgi:hypothetical protein
MRNTIRRNPNVSYNVQMFMREEDAFRSRIHPNSIANDERQRSESRLAREAAAAAKSASRAARRERRMRKKGVAAR